MTQKELAELLDTSRATIANWETGRANPNLEYITKIAKVFETTPNYLLESKTTNKKGLHFTVPNSDLSFLQINEGDIIIYHDFRYPKTGHLMILKNNELSNKPFIAKIILLKGNLYYQQSLQDINDFTNSIEVIGLCKELNRTL